MRLGAQTCIQALELISFSGNPYLVSNLICLLALSGNAKARKCRLQWSCILALESQQKGKFGAGKFAFLHNQTTKIHRIFKEKVVLKY
jgi:hypothetical protein